MVKFLYWNYTNQGTEKCDLAVSTVDNLYSVTFLSRTLIFECCVVRCGSNNRYQKDMCLKEIGLHAQNIRTILGSTVNIIGGTYMTILNLTLIMHKIIV